MEHTSTATVMWTRMPGQTWPGAAASFLAMWVAMMVVMMLPSLIPALARYQREVRRDDRIRSAGIVGLGYFFVWTAIGAGVFPIGAAIAIALRAPVLARAGPVAVGVVMFVVGLLQLTTSRGHAPLGNDGSAWRHGLRLGLRCAWSCAGLMTAGLVMGIMNLRVMAIVTAAITLERLAKDPVFVARTIGLAAIGAGVFLISAAVAGS